MAVVGEDARERVAVGGVAPAGGDDRTGRVGGDELEQDPLGARGAAGAVAGASVEHAAQGRTVPAVGERQVQEARPGHLEAGEQLTEAHLQIAAQLGGDIARRGAERGCQQHRRVGGVVALAGALGALELGHGTVADLAVAATARGRCGGVQRRSQLGDRIVAHASAAISSARRAISVPAIV